MSRSGYSDYISNWELIKYRGQVASAIRGKRGQKFLKELVEILDSMPTKELARETLEANGSFCTIGSALHAKGIPIPDEDSAWGNPEVFAKSLNVSWQLIGEIIFENDDNYRSKETPAQRWQRMRNWAESQITKEPQ